MPKIQSITLYNLYDKSNGHKIGPYTVSIDDLIWADQNVDPEMDAKKFFILACDFLQNHYHTIDINTDAAKIDEIYYG